MKYGCLQFATIFVVIVIFCVPQLACEGFVAGALVKSVNAYVPIETLQVGDEVSCYDGTGAVAVEKLLLHIYIKHHH